MCHACELYNSGAKRQCQFCLRNKGKRDRLLWPEYEAACKKAGIEPGTRWPVRPEPSEPPKAVRRAK